MPSASGLLVPGQVLPLHIFEPRYRQLVAELVDGAAGPATGPEFGVVAIREGHEVGAEAVRALHEVGTTARLQTVQQYPDGRYDIATLGTRRFRIAALDHRAPYLRADVAFLPERPGDAAAALAPAVRRELCQYRERLAALGSLDAIDPDDLPDDPAALSYLVVTATVLDRADRQRLLECPDDAARLRAGLALLRRESALAVHLPSVPAGDLAQAPVSPN